MARLRIPMCILSALIGIGLAGGGGATAAPQPVTGRVFADADESGDWSEGDRGIAGVVISDGVRFTRTGGDGAYELQADRVETAPPGSAPVVTCSVPDGFRAVTPWFRRPATEPPEAGTDFVLAPQEQPLPFTFVHATDAHVPRGGEDLFPRFRDELRNSDSDVRFAVLTGDLVNLADQYTLEKARADYALLTNVLKDFPVPVYCTPGNHEPVGVSAGETGASGSPDHGFGTYLREIGPLRWSFNYAGCHFVGIDFSTVRDGKWSWGVSDEAARWLERDLELAPEGSRRFLFVHWPSGSDQLKTVLRDGEIERFFAGHSHQDREPTSEKTRGFISGSLSQVWDDRPIGYRLVRVGEDGIDTFYKPLGEARAVSVTSPRREHIVQDASVVVRGTYHDPGRRAGTVTVRLGEAEATAPVQPGDLWGAFAVELPTAAVAAGDRILRVDVTGPEYAGRAVRRAMVDNNVLPADWIAPEGAELVIASAGVDVGVEVILNGETFGEIVPGTRRGDGPFAPPLADTDDLTLPIPPEKLRRLNRVELRARTGENGTADVFCITDARIRLAGKDLRDPNFGGHGPRQIKTIRNTRTVRIDIAPDHDR